MLEILFGQSFRRKKTWIAAMLLFVMLLVPMFSSVYIAKEANHDCSGTNCPVCVIIHQCEDNIKRMEAVNAAIITAVIMIFFVGKLLLNTENILYCDTLITRKVRLND